MSDLVPRLLFGSLDLTEAPYLLEFGSDFGGPETIQTAMAQLLQDGEIVSGDRSSNRELQFSILVEGSDFQAMADAEAALILESNRPRNTITWDPGDGWGPATMYDTFRATATLVRSDEMESARLRRYSLTIPALPFGRSVGLVTAVGAPPGAATVIDSGDSTTGWAAGGGIATNTDFYVSAPSSLRTQATGPVYGGGGSGYYRFYGDAARVGAVDMAGDDYLSVKVRQAASNGATVRLRVDGGSLLDPVSATATASTMGTGFVEYVFAVGVASFTRLDFAFDGKMWGEFPPQAFEAGIWIDGVSRLGAPTGRQATLTLPMQGSVRAPVSIHVASTAGLGDVMLLTHGGNPALTPNCRRWRVAGGTPVSDLTAVSGFYDNLGTTYGTPTFDQSANTFTPGSYNVMARVRDSGGGGSFRQISAELSTVVGGAVVGGIQEVTARIEPVPASWVMVPVGQVHLPTAMLGQATTGTVRVRLKSPAGLQVDDVWLIPSDGELTIAACGTAKHLWVDSPSVDLPYGTVLVGATGDRTDAYAVADLGSLGRHHLAWPTAAVFLVSTGTATPTLDVSYFPHWHTNAAS